jgi:exosortase H (IPTLxxWG-CTERM-specific)
MRRFALLFLAVLVTLFAAELTPPGQALVVEPWTALVARVSTFFAHLFDPTIAVSGPTLYAASGFAMTIMAGCNGLEATIVLLAAIVAYPAPWRHRIAGLAAGILAIQVLNIVRLVSLFYLGQWNLRVFEWAHLYAWQVLIMLDALIVWLLWLKTIPARSHAAAPA